MRAKKLISIALLAALGTSTQAQIVSSRSDQVIVTQQLKEKKPKKPWLCQWYLKAGVSLDKSEEYVKETKMGYLLLAGLKSPIGQQGAFWGIEAGGISSTYEDFFSKHGPVVSNISAIANPYLGWNIDISNQTSIAPHVGPYISYPFDGHPDRSILLGIGIGANVWFSRNIGIGISYHRDVAENDWTDKTSKIGLNLLYAF